MAHFAARTAFRCEAAPAAHVSLALPGDDGPRRVALDPADIADQTRVKSPWNKTNRCPSWLRINR